jgi:hypothetical protein
MLRAMSLDGRRIQVFGWLFVASLLIALAAMALLEPVVHDGWCHYARVLRHGDDPIRALQSYSPGRTNPRIGQALLPLTYFRFPVHAILSPLMILFLVVSIFVHATGRWPRFSQGRDVALFVAISSMIWLLVPQVGHIFFYRPVLANYVYGLVFSLAVLIPLRLHGTTNRSSPNNLALVGGLFVGALAGMANEHTGPVVILLYVLGVARVWRASGAPLRLVPAGMTLLLGYLYLFFSPAQSKRYGAIATESSLFDNVVNRGLSANLALLWRIVDVVWPVLAILAVVTLVLAVGRRARSDSVARGAGWSELTIPVVWGGAALVTGGIVMASPIVGGRLLFAPTVFTFIAVTWWLDRLLSWRALVLPTQLTALGVHLWFFSSALPLYATLHEEFEDRAEVVGSTRPGDVALVPLMTSSEGNRLFNGDNFKYRWGRRRARLRCGRDRNRWNRSPLRTTTGRRIFLARSAAPGLRGKARRIAIRCR